MIAIVLLACAVLTAQQPSGEPPITAGPKVGDVVPDFELRDQRGIARTLSSLLGPKGAMLVFYRSADW